MAKINQQTIDLIRTNDKVYPHDKGEQDLKEFIKKRKAAMIAGHVIHNVNQLHLKDETLVKWDLERNIKIIKDNKDVL